MISFQTLGLKFLGLAIHLPELFSLALAPLAITQIIKSRQKLLIDNLDLFVFGWLIATIISGWHSGFDSIVATEIIKTAYLVMLYMILKWTITLEVIERMVKVIILSSFFTALTGILGFVLGNLGIETFLAIKRPFPYGIENVIQAKGFTPSPNMLASIIMIGVFFQLQKLSKNRTIPNRKDYLIFLTLLIGFSLTFSKTVVCLLIGIILILYLNHKSILSFTWRLATSFVIIGLFIAYIIATHFIIVEKDKSFEHLKGDYIAGPAIIELANYSIYPSQYWSLKKIAFQASVESFPWGLGPGKFNNFAYESKKNSSYPTHVPYPDPHSTYLGTLAEIGLLGFAALFGIITFIIKYSRNFVKDNLVNQHLIVCLPVIFIVIGIEAICTDVMNFRYYWIVLAILVNTNFKE